MMSQLLVRIVRTPCLMTLIMLLNCSSAAARSERRQALRNGTSTTAGSSIGSSGSMQQQQQHEHELIDERTDLFDAELSRIPEHRCVTTIVKFSSTYQTMLQCYQYAQ
jgi:hypothetical protein